MTQTPTTDVQKARQAQAAEHARLTRELQTKPITQVFIEEAERILTEQGFDLSLEAVQQSKRNIVKRYEKGHYSTCQDVAGISYLDRTPENIALGNILATNSGIKQNFDAAPSVAEIFHDAADKALASLPHTERTKSGQDKARNTLIQKFENKLYQTIELQAGSWSTRPSPQQLAQNAVEKVTSGFDWANDLD